MLTVSQAAHAAGLDPRTIRYYESFGLIPKPSRKASPFNSATPGYRMYTPEDMQRLRIIKHARTMGFSLAQIKAIFAGRAGEAQAQRLKVLETVEQRLREIERHLEDLQLTKAKLKRMQRRLSLPFIQAQSACCEPLCGPETCGSPGVAPGSASQAAGNSSQRR